MRLRVEMLNDFQMNTKMKKNLMEAKGRFNFGALMVYTLGKKEMNDELLQNVYTAFNGMLDLQM